MRTEIYKDTENFYVTLKRDGKPTEIEGNSKFHKYLTTKHDTTLDDYMIETNDDYKYDTIFKSKLEELDFEVKIEIKYDKEGSNTGNVAIEFGSRGKISGISKSKADFWLIKFVYKNTNVFYYINRKRLFDIVFINPKYFLRTLSKNGNDLALFKQDIFEEEIMEGQWQGDGSRIFINKEDTFVEKKLNII